MTYRVDANANRDICRRTSPVSAQTIIALLLVALLVGIVMIFGRWVFACAARQKLLEA